MLGCLNQNFKSLDFICRCLENCIFNRWRLSNAIRNKAYYTYTNFYGIKKKDGCNVFLCNPSLRYQMACSGILHSVDKCLPVKGNQSGFIKWEIRLLFNSLNPFTKQVKTGVIVFVFKCCLFLKLSGNIMIILMTDPIIIIFFNFASTWQINLSG